MINIYVLNTCTTTYSIFAGGSHTLTSITAISVAIVGFALLYRYRGRLKEKSPYAFYGLIVVVLLVGVVAVSIATTTVTQCTDSNRAGISVSQEAGMVDITVVSLGSLDSVRVVGPNGTRSTMVKRVSEASVPLRSGTRITLRSNEEVLNYLDENDITVPTTSGTKTVESVNDLPSEYQKAPDGLIDPDADIGNYDNASVATVACLYTAFPSFELGERKIPSETSIPCNTPILAQDDIEEDYLGTHVKPILEPNKALTSPIILRDGEHQLIGTVDGQEEVVQAVEVPDEQDEENDDTREEMDDDTRDEANETVTEGEE